MRTELLTLLSLLCLLARPLFALQEKFEVDPSNADEWLNDSKDSFSPEEWVDFHQFENLEAFQTALKSEEEVYIFFYNKDDPGTYSIHPFYKTSADIMKLTNPQMPTWTVDMAKTPEIPLHYSLDTRVSCVFYFYKGAPILFKFDQMEKTKKPIDQWMRDVKQMVSKVRVVKDENDMDVFENSSRLIFMFVDEENRWMAEMMAALGFNYPELTFAYMVRHENSMGVEDEVNGWYGFENDTTGSKPSL